MDLTDKRHLNSASNSARNAGRRSRNNFRNLLQRWLRRRHDALSDASYILQKNDFGIRLAESKSKVNRVEMLVTRMYRQRGYDTSTKSLDQDSDASAGNLRRITLEACRESRIVGTITVNLDSPSGLNAEDLYREEIAPYRQKGKRLCEFNRLALDIEQCGKEALGNLFHLAFIFAYRIHRASDLFIEVNPRHSLFYRRKLGFKIVGEEKVCRRVNAPAVLLHQELSSISEQIARYGGLKLAENKTFYSFLMAPWEEKELTEEITRILAQTRLTMEKPTAFVAA